MLYRMTAKAERRAYRASYARYYVEHERGAAMPHQSASSCSGVSFVAAASRNNFATGRGIAPSPRE